MHAHIQTEFAAAVLDADRAVPDAVTSHTLHHPQKRFAVYRNNVAASLINALRARFPATEKIVGEEFFAAMAHQFIVDHLPRSPVLMFYGDEFPPFIEQFEPARELPYLPDVARLEAARTIAYHAADAAPLGIEKFQALSPGEAMAASTLLHPAVNIIRSGFPVVTIWAMNSGDMELAPVNLDRPEDALILRPHLSVLVHALPRGGAVFLGTLSQGRSIGEAAELAGADAAFDLPENLALLFGSGIVTALAAPHSLERRHHD